jgi:transcriptional regulator with XRE-family HTH domain
MNVGEKIKKVREAKGFSQKEVALTLQMNPSQYSKIESGKVDPQFSSIERIAVALGVEVADIFNSDKLFSDVNSFDKTVVEKVQLIEQLEDGQKKSIFSIIDMAIYNIKMKQTLTNALALNL